MKPLTTMGWLITTASGFLIAVIIYVCTYIKHSCFDVSLNIPVLIFFIGLACISFGMLEDDKGLK